LPSFITVVYGRELSLLRLQARSLARFAPPSLVHEILVIVNDAREDFVAGQIEEMRDEYGPHAAKVRVVLPEEVFRPMALSRLGAMRILNVPRRWIRHAGGWRGHPGWLVQQALKLAVGRVVGSEATILLDAKNIFLMELREDDFFDSDGRGRTGFILADGRNKAKWFPPSAAAVGLSLPPGSLPPSTHFLTPFPVATAVLLQTLADIEKQGRTVAEVMLVPRVHPTEFFLISASVILHSGAVESEFAERSEAYIGLAAKSDTARVDEVTDLVGAVGPRMVALHAKAWLAMTQKHHAQLYTGLERARLVATRAEYDALFEAAGRAS
jgi:hypothetical protein